MGTPSKDTGARRSRGGVTPRYLISLEVCEIALPGSDAISVGVPLARFLWKGPFSESSRLVTAGAEGLGPSSISGCLYEYILSRGRTESLGCGPGKVFC